MSILCTTDFSDASRAAIRTAAQLADAREVALTVLHILEVTDAAGWAPTSASLDLSTGNLREEARRHLRDFVDETLGEAFSSLDLDLRIDRGRPDVRVCEIADTDHYAMLVVGARGRDRMANTFVGSTTEDIVRRSDRPVLVVPRERHARSFERVIAPVDFSATSRRSLELAIAVAQTEGASLEIVHAYTPPGANVPVLGPLVSPSREDEIEAERGERFQSFVEEFDFADLDAATRFRHGRPERVVPEIVDDVGTDLIVMGTHGRSGFEKLVMGSTANRILRRMPCSVLTVRSTE
ncbi:MAG: universal stress protein [Bradymonadaceae bacterium]